MNSTTKTETPRDYIDCRESDKTVVGPWAHQLYLHGDYLTKQAGQNLFAVYYVGEEKSELRACQSSLSGAMRYADSPYHTIVMLKPNNS